MNLEMGASFADASRAAADSVVCGLPKPPQHCGDLEQAKEKQLPEPRSPGAPLFALDPNPNFPPLGSLPSGALSPSGAPFEQPGRAAALAPNWEGRIPLVVDKVLELKRLAMEDLRAQIYAQHGAAAFGALTAQMDEQLPAFVRDPQFSLEEFKEILVLTKSVIDEKAADISKAKRVEAYLHSLRQTAPVSSSPGEAPESPLVNPNPKSPWNESVGLPSLSLVTCPTAASQPPSAPSRASAGVSANPLPPAPFSSGGSGESISMTLRRQRSLSTPSGSSPASPAVGFGGGAQGDWNHNAYDPESRAEELRGAYPLPKRPATWSRKRQRASCAAGSNGADPSCNSKHPAGFDEQRWFVPVDFPSETNATVQSASVGEAARVRRKGRPHCGHCNVYGHFIETCFDLHPHLRGSRSQAQRPQPKRASNNPPAVVAHATQVPMPSPVTEVARPRGRRPFCSNCNRNGHYLDRCFRLYPHLRSEQQRS